MQNSCQKGNPSFSTKLNATVNIGYSHGSTESPGHFRLMGGCFGVVNINMPIVRPQESILVNDKLKIVRNKSQNNNLD